MTTEAKARTVRPAAEKVITLAKRGIASGKDDPASEVHARRLASNRVSRIRVVEDETGDLEEVDVISSSSPRWRRAIRSGPVATPAWSRLGKRPGDNADMALLMLVEDEQGE